ncbi:endonuclease domain-containing protein [Lichenibacterium dinghuense]|uniref:endonuclease domain-containing protein n=1 Tax=Lichenibacterium dinghuense TaxID=2895977 RepID=UPI001F19F13C|nr:DUF559 domain-containing protein [Lichenibacterium sp. 6Y81]
MTGDGELPGLAPGDLGPAVARLAPGRRLVLVGADRRGASELLWAEADLGRSVLFLAPADARGAGAVVGRLLDDLGDLALARWPDWPGAEAGPWRRAAGRLAAAGRAPRLRRADPGTEFAGLRGAVDPRGLAVVAEVDPASARRARGTVEALEWCAARGAPTVALLPHRPAPEPPYDRLLYGARALLPAPEPAAERFIAQPGTPHPGSETERRIRAALDRDAELGPLFACNRLVTDAGLRRPRVDLLWAAGRVVVELDGPEHRAGPQYGDDRHRDYELLVAGYYVLRITNAQVAADLPREIEKIRAVVRFSRERTTR